MPPNMRRKQLDALFYVHTLVLHDDHLIAVDSDNTQPYFDQQLMFMDVRNPPLLVRTIDTLDRAPLKECLAEPVSPVPFPS